MYVYKVTSPSTKVYIGITNDFEFRKIQHISKAMNGGKSKFNSAIRKYKDLLKWEILKSGISRELACLYERYYIKVYNSFKLGYNSTTGGDEGFNRDRTPEHTENNRISNIEFYNKYPEEREKRSRRVKQYYIDNPDKRFKLNEWRENNPEEVKKAREKINSILSSKEGRLKNSIGSGAKPFNAYDMVDKKYIGTYQLRSELARELNISNGKISAVLNGVRRRYKNYIFKYLDDPTVNGHDYNPIWDLGHKRWTRKK